MRKSLIASLSFLVVLANLALAQDIIIATDISYADFAIASVVSSKIGAPVYFVSKERIPSEILSEIQSIAPETIYIIGGPAVISEAIENELKLTYNVVRIWGMTRYGTSAEVAKYFWPEGSEEAVLVWDLPDSPEVNLSVSIMVSKAAEEAEDEGIPLLLIQKNHLSYEIEEALKTLNVSEVKVFGNVGSKVFEQLTALNISYEWVSGEPEEIEEKMEERAEELFREMRRPLVVAAVANWQEGVAVRATPKGVSILVFNEQEIPKVTERVSKIVATGNVTRVLVVGKPELAQKIYDALIAAGINETVPVIFVTGKHFEITKEIFEQTRERFKEMMEEFKERMEEIRAKLQRVREKIETRCKFWLMEANESLSKINTSLAAARLALVKELHNECIKALNEGKPMIAMRYLNEIKHQMKFVKWRERSRIWEEFREELEEEEREAEVFKEKLKLRWGLMKKALDITRMPEEVREKIIECKELINELQKAIEEGDFEKARELKIEIAETCAVAKIRRIREEVTKWPEWRRGMREIEEIMRRMR